MPNITQAQAQGNRKTQEDFLVVLPFGENALIAIMDGSRGDEAARWCADHIPKLFHSDIAAHNPAEALKMLASKLDIGTRQMESSTTLSMIYITPIKAYAAYLGDSPIIIKNASGQIIMSNQHNVRSNRMERELGIARGGQYADGYLWDPQTGVGLQYGRALGSREMGIIINHEPEYLEATLGPDSFVIVCSDGLLDPSHDDTSHQLVHEALSIVEKSGTARDLLAWTESLNPLEDNATVAVWRAKFGFTKSKF